jgi:hypothetical protein
VPLLRLSVRIIGIPVRKLFRKEVRGRRPDRLGTGAHPGLGTGAHPGHIGAGTGAHPGHICAGTGARPLPHLRRDWALPAATSAPGLGLGPDVCAGTGARTLPRLRRDSSWSRGRRPRTPDTRPLATRMAGG